MDKGILIAVGLLIILAILATGCISSYHMQNMTAQPTPSPEPSLPVTSSQTSIPTVTIQTPIPTTVPATIPTTIPVATLTTKPIPAPTINSIYVYGINYQVYALSRDNYGVITKGNITLSGVIDSLSAYPLKVILRGDMFGPQSLLTEPKATAYSTVFITPHGTSGFIMHMDDYVFNDWPGYAIEPDRWNLTVESVSVAE